MAAKNKKPDTRNKRTKSQIAADRSVIANMMIEGRTSYVIKDHINSIRDGYDLSTSSIIYDMRIIQKQWVASYLQDINVAKAKELARIDRVERAAWDAWEKSKDPARKTEKEKVESEQLDSGDRAFQKHRKVRAKTTEMDRDADKEFMKIVQWCVDTRCKILGINAPQRYDISWKKQAEAAGVDPIKFQKNLEDQFVAAAEKGIATE